MYIDRDFALLTTATWSCRAPTLTDSVGEVFLCPGRTSGTSCHLTFGKCPLNQNNLLEHRKLFYFQTALTSTSEDNIKRRAIAKTSTSTSDGCTFVPWRGGKLFGRDVAVCTTVYVATSSQLAGSVVEQAADRKCQI